jgi:hypothetical protein
MRALFSKEENGEKEKRTGDDDEKQKNKKECKRAARAAPIRHPSFVTRFLVVYPRTKWERKTPLLRRLASSMPTYASHIYRIEKKRKKSPPS